MPPKAEVSPSAPDILTRVEAAAFCRVSLRTFDRHVQRAVTPVRPLYPLRFRRADLEAWMFADADEDAPPPMAPMSLAEQRAVLRATPARESVNEIRRARREAARPTDAEPEPARVSLAEQRKRLRASMWK